LGIDEKGLEGGDREISLRELFLSFEVLPGKARIRQPGCISLHSCLEEKVVVQTKRYPDRDCKQVDIEKERRALYPKILGSLTSLFNSLSILDADGRLHILLLYRVAVDLFLLDIGLGFSGSGLLRLFVSLVSGELSEVALDPSRDFFPTLSSPHRFVKGVPASTVLLLFIAIRTSYQLAAYDSFGLDCSLTSNMGNPPPCSSGS
jgi:hypothetical protein